MLKYECYILECKEGPQTLCKILFQHLAINVLQKKLKILYKEAASRPSKYLPSIFLKHVPKSKVLNLAPSF